jgi:hypothetical protein
VYPGIGSPFIFAILPVLHLNNPPGESNSVAVWKDASIGRSEARCGNIFHLLLALLHLEADILNTGITGTILSAQSVPPARLNFSFFIILIFYHLNYLISQAPVIVVDSNSYVLFPLESVN